MPRGEKQREPDLRKLLTSDVLEVLRRPTTFVPPSLRVTTPGKGLQLFEVLSAYLMSLVESDFEWVVTPVQHDGGVDFYGEKRLFPIRGFEDYKVVIAGQCKASKTVRQPLPNGLLRLLNSIRPAIVYVFLMTPMSPRRIGEAQRIFFAETNRPCRILDLQCVVDLLSIHREDVLGFIRSSLDESGERILRSFVQRLPIAPSVASDVKLTVQERVLAGTPFQVQVKLNSLLLGGRPVRVSWTGAPDVILIKPVEIHGEEGFCLSATETFSSRFTLKLVTYQVGEVQLGELVFESEGKTFKEATLGKVSAVDQYQPIFFWEPYQRQRTRFLEVLDQAAASAPQGIAVTGQGGTGKTRFCQELGYLAEQRGGNFISVAHPQHLSLPYRIFGLLAEELLGEPVTEKSPREAIEAYLRELHPSLVKKASGTIAAAFSADGGEGKTFDSETMVEVLLVMLLQRAKNAGCVLHVSDLHWASLEALNVLGGLLQRLQKIAREYHVPVLMVFEGRVQTSIGRPGGKTTDWRTSTALFESFIARFGLERLSIEQFTTTESRAFLKYLFENTQSASRSVPLALIPHQEVLIEEISRYGQGNPFHMIEQIKLLRQEGVVARNARTGLIYLAKRPARHYQVPASVHELIALRLQFVEHSQPELALLIKAVGLIKDKIDMQLFEQLRSRLAPRSSLAILHQIEVLDADRSAYVGFRHENYYQVVRESALTAPELRLIAGVYLEWYRRQPRTSPAVLYEEALVRTRLPRIDRPTVSRLLADALRKAESTHQYQLAIQIIERLLQFTEEEAGDARSDRLRHLLKSLELRSRLATFSIEVQDWALGSDQYEAILDTVTQALNYVPTSNVSTRKTLNYFRAGSLVELANTMTDLGRSHEAIRCLADARKICEACIGGEAKIRGDAKWYALYGRLLNRLGEAHWMDGNYEEALRSIEAATAAIDRHVENPKQKRLLHHINLLDYGAVLLHKSPRRAVRELKRSKALIPASGWHPHYKILANITLVIGECVERFLRGKGCSPSFRRYIKQYAFPQFLKAFEQAKFYGLKQEQVAASLMLGVSQSLLEESTAKDWYMESIEVAFRSNNLESLWRGHLNLAQFLADCHDEEASHFHAHRAAALLADDLRPRQPVERKWRQRHLLRPLRRIARLIPDSELTELHKYFPATEEPEKRVVDRQFFSDRIVYLWYGDHEYYPYGG